MWRKFGLVRRRPATVLKCLGSGTFAVLLLMEMIRVSMVEITVADTHFIINDTRGITGADDYSNTSTSCVLSNPPRVPQLIKPETTSDLTHWSFKHKRRCVPFSLNATSEARAKFNFYCAEGKSYINYTFTSALSDIMAVDFKDQCLSTFITGCCRDRKPVPNIVHYVWFGERDIDYFNFISLMSVYRFIQPCAILIHGPDLPRGRYWEHFLKLSPNVVHVYRQRPTQVFGNNLRFKEHSSDIMRIEALKEYGGIYLDFDEVVLRPLEPLRRYPHTQGHELDFTMGSQLVMSKKNSTFLNMWYESYRNDYKKIWAYNALWVPNTLAKLNPHLIHVEGFNFTRPSWKRYKEIFEMNYDWSTNYGMHMFSRWYKKKIDPQIMRTLNTTVGSVSRHILLGNKELCID